MMSEEDYVRATAARWQACWRQVQTKSLQGVAIMIFLIICGRLMGF